MKLKRISAVVIAMAVIFSFMSFSAFAETNLIDLLAGETVSGLPTELSGAGTEADPYLINDVYDLIFFANTVNTYQSNGSNQFTGKYILLTADIDLGAYNWHPIGTAPDHASFNGVFDGGNHTISNLTCIGNSAYLGFFARVGNFGEVGNPTVKNVKFNNVTIQTTGSYVGGVIANSGGNSTVSNVHITGSVDIEGYGYVGGIIGHGYPKVDNCSVDATGTIYSNYWCCGGIVGYGGEGNGATSIKNSSVSGIEIYARSGGAAAILGVGISGAYGENISAENVTISSNSDYCMGYVFGNGEEGTIKNVTVNNVTATANGNPITSTDCIATIGNDYYPSLQEALNAAADGETIELISDITLENPVDFGKSMKITLDGKGYTVKPSSSFSTNVHGFNLGINGSNYDSTRDYTIKNIVFEGWPTDHTLRLEGIKATVEGCTFKNNIQPKPYGTGTLGIVTVTRSEALIKDCLFDDNDVIKCIDVNSYGDNSLENTVIENCIFRNNIANGVAVILYSDGASLTVNNSTFKNNTVNLNKDGAVIYLGFVDGGKVTNSVFEDNTVNTVHDTTERVAGAVYAGNNAFVNGNVFKNNTATRNGAEAGFAQVCDGAYYNSSNFEGNYWSDGSAPVVGKDIYFEYDKYPLVVDSYYENYSIDAEGKLTLSNLKPNPDKLIISFEETTKKGVYDIVVTSSRIDKKINELSTAKLTFVNESKNNDGTDMGYSISGAAPYNYLVEGDTYTFYAKDGSAMTNNTTSVKLGQVTFAGYGEIDFAVDKTADNKVIIKTSKDNAELEFTGDTLVVDTEGTDGDAEAAIDEAIKPETADLTIEVDYVHDVVNNAAAYQKMTIEITGLDLLGEVITFKLGDDGDYAACGNATAESNVAHNKHTVVVSDKLIKGNSYTVKVYGDGYRTAEYTIRMDNDKTLKFWNNVMTSVTKMEKDDATGTYTNFLAGDILPDEIINVYDLSAVVSYFGENPKANASYIQYDLNRDGKIDGLDISILLNSWGK